MEKTRYYKFNIGSVIVRCTGMHVEKKGKKGIWEDAPELYARFLRDDSSLTEISAEEAEALERSSTATRC